MHVIVYRYHEYALPLVPLLIGMFQDIQNISILDMEQDLLERNAAFRTQLLILLGVPVEAFHMAIVAQRVPNGITLKGCLTNIFAAKME